MTKAQIKQVITNFDKNVKVADIQLLKGFELLEARAICITNWYGVTKFWFYKDGTFRCDYLEEPIIHLEEVSYHKTCYYLDRKEVTE